MDQTTQLRQQATIGVITALPKEFIAVEVMLESPVPWSAPGEGAGRQYVLGEVPAADGGRHVVALALLADVGTHSAAISASKLLEHFPSVRHIIMCGIAGGIPGPASSEDDVRLGDIVVSDRNGVVNYDFIKQTPDAIEERTPPRPPGAELLEAVNLLEARRLRLQRPWEPYLDRTRLLEDAARPPDELGADGHPMKYPADARRRPGLPRVFRGSIASANRLLKDEQFRDALRLRFKTKAVEMEGFGIADATWWSDRAGYLVVRGICDYCDMRKGDLWQGYAAVAAAAYVRALIASMSATASHAKEAPPPSAGAGGSRPGGPLTEEMKAAKCRWAELKKCGAPPEELKVAREELIRLQRLDRAGRILRAGDVLSGRYEILSLLGQGGFATVWKAFDLEEHQDVAVKLLHHQYVEDRTRRERFFKGAATMARLNHPHIVRVLEKRASDDEHLYFVMEYIAGGNLRTRVEQGSMDSTRLISLLCQVGDALQHAHAQGIVHRDVKPANILVEPRGLAWLTDFDLIKVEDSSWGTREEPMGSFMYAAPEVMEAATEADARSDIFSLGMVATFGLHGGHLPATAFRHGSSFVASLDIPEAMKNVLARALQWEPSRRQSTIKEFCQALRDALTTQGDKPGVDSARPRNQGPGDIILGVDFGTTSSLVSIFRNGTPAIIPNILGSKTTPSVVSFQKDGTVIVGEPARAQAWSNPEHTIFSVKRRLGTDWSVTIHGKKYTAVDIASLILAELRRDAERFLGFSVAETVLTVPAYFSIRQKKDLEKAALQAGFLIRRLVVEPTAAVLAQGMDRLSDDVTKFCAVCDLGGGTFDVSIIEPSELVADVVAVNGNAELGGDDFDERLVDHLLELIRRRTGLDLSADATARIRIKEAVERAKITLSSARSARVHVPYLFIGPAGAVHLDEELTRETFESLVGDLIEKLLDCCAKAVADVSSDWRSYVTTLVLVGLSTRIPLVREKLSEFFGLQPRGWVAADEAVAMGSAVLAGILQGENRKLLLLDVMPRALGVAFPGKGSEQVGVVVRGENLFPFTRAEIVLLVERNTTIPTKSREVIRTEAKELLIVQSENRGDHEFSLLKRLNLEQLRGDAKGSVELNVLLDIDANSVLDVCVANQATDRVEGFCIAWGNASPTSPEKIWANHKQWKRDIPTEQIRNAGSPVIVSTEGGIGEGER